VSKTHKRLPKEVFDEVFRFILRVAARKGLLSPEAIGIDSTTIQANASMRSIVRKDSGTGWKDDTKKLAKKAGLDDPTDDELRQFDRTRPGKTVSNDDWEHPHDPDAAITRMKDGTTRMGSKAEHAVDLETDIVVAVNVQPGNAPDTATIIATAIDAAVNAEQAGVETDVAARAGERRETAPDGHPVSDQENHLGHGLLCLSFLPAPPVSFLFRIPLPSEARRDPGAAVSGGIRRAAVTMCKSYIDDVGFAIPRAAGTRSRASVRPGGRYGQDFFSTACPTEEDVSPARASWHGKVDLVGEALSAGCQH
jgi:hypothetical protein